jgi:hypothetical protein
MGGAVMPHRSTGARTHSPSLYYSCLIIIIKKLETTYSVETTLKTG